MKKILYVGLIASVMGLAACGKKAEDTPAVQQTEATSAAADAHNAADAASNAANEASQAAEQASQAAHDSDVHANQAATAVESTTQDQSTSVPAAQ